MGDVRVTAWKAHDPISFCHWLALSLSLARLPKPDLSHYAYHLSLDEMSKGNEWTNKTEKTNKITQIK